MQKKVKVIVVISFLILSLMVIYGSVRVYTVHKLQQSVNYFLTSIATGDIKNINAVGEVLWKVGSSENLPSSEVSNIAVYTSQFNRKWARAQAILELKLADKSVTVNWYELDLINDAGIWKVVSVREIMPCLLGVSGLYDTEGPTKVLGQYLSALHDQSPNRTPVYLAGPARKAEEQSMNDLPVGEVEGLQVTPLYGNKQFLVTKAACLIDKKPVSNLVSFYNTCQGWKIVAVQAL